MKRFQHVLFLFVLILVSCRSNEIQGSTPDLPAPQVDSDLSTSIPEQPAISNDGSDEENSAKQANQLNFASELFRIDAIGLELQHPQGWMVDEIVLGSRAYAVNLTSWQYPAGQFEEVPEGESILSVTVYQWDPKGDLDAYIQTRLIDVWAVSGIQITREEEWLLGGDHRAVAYTIRNEVTRDEAFFLATLAGDDYLVLSGSGDLPLLEEIARTTTIAK